MTYSKSFAKSGAFNYSVLRSVGVSLNQVIKKVLNAKNKAKQSKMHKLAKFHQGSTAGVKCLLH